MHVAHAVSPEPSWYLPEAHLVHEPWPVAGCTVPGLHSVEVVDPVEQNEPGGQSVQSLASSSPVALLNVPSTQGNGAEAPERQYDPAVHA